MATSQWHLLTSYQRGGVYYCIPPGPSIAPLPPCISFFPCLLWHFQPLSWQKQAYLFHVFVFVCVCVLSLFNAFHPFSFAPALAMCPLWHVVRESVVAPSPIVFSWAWLFHCRTELERYASSLLCCLSSLAPCVLVCVCFASAGAVWLVLLLLAIGRDDLQSW